MIFPRGEVVHKNLSTAYTDLSALLATLKLEEFCGTIEIDFPGARGALFIDSGEVVNGEVRAGENSGGVFGQKAVDILLGFSQQKEGVLSIYRLLPEHIALIANHLDDEMLFRNLSTRFVRLEQFLSKLKEERHTGFIEVMTKEHQPVGVLFLEGGEAVGMFTTPKTGPSVFGRMSIPIFIENTIHHDSFFNVYGKKGTSPQLEEMIILKEEEALPTEEEKETGTVEEVSEEVLAHFHELLSGAERLVDKLSSQGTFTRIFKKARLEKSETFGFLDPFAGEFEYGNGAIRFTGEANKMDFAKGMVETFRVALSYLEEELPKEKIISLKLKAGIESFLEQHKEALRRLEIEEAISSLIQ